MTPIHSSFDADFAPFTKDDVERSIPEVFGHRTGPFADRIAIQSNSKSYTYRALNTAANRVAYAILDQLARGNDPVAIFMSDTSDAVVAILGALKAGKIYLPLDLSLPPSRLRYLIEDSRARLIVAETKTLTAARALSSVRNIPVLNMDFQREGPDTAGDPDLPIPPDSLASLLYTSGSTAQPKGVVQNHRNLLHMALRYTNSCRITYKDRIALLRTLTVSGGTLHSLGALLNGASLLPFNLKRDDIADLARWLRAREVTLCSFGPSLLRSIAEIMAAPESLPALRRVTLSGEPLYRADIELCRRLFSPDCVLINSLGATEAPLAVQYRINAKPEEEGNLVPVGYSTADIRVTLRDENGQVVGNHEAGEIALQSRYLAVGYWGNPELTQVKFLPAPDNRDERIYLTGDLGRFAPDGTLIHLGRKDDLVKIRGYRIGLVEIEAALLEHPCVKQAAVVPWDETDGEKYLAAYVVPDDDVAPTAPELTTFLRARLPDFMIPAQFMFMAEFPQINHKIDRKALPRIARSSLGAQQGYTPPRDAFERTLTEIWERVLGISPIGIHDLFLNLGGDSLKATRIIASLSSSSDCAVSIASFFDAKTIAGLAHLLLDTERTEEGKI
jgi:amino acid adenylation domain-containing protein